MLVIEFPTQWKDEQVGLVISEVNDKLVQISEFETNAEAKVQDIVFTLRIKVGGKRVYVDVTYSHMDNVSFHPETNFQKWKYALQRRF